MSDVEASDRATWRVLLWVLVVAVGVLLTIVVLIQPENRAHEPLTPRQLHNATFAPPPATPPPSATLAQVWADLHGPGGTAFLQRLLPTQSGTLWIALIVALLIAFDYARLRSPRNIDMLALLAVGFLLFDIMRFFSLLTDPIYFRVMDWVFTAIVTVSVFLCGRALWRVGHPYAVRWQPNLPARALAVLTILLLALNLFVVLVRAPDDVGFYTNLGAQRLRERGMFPYGDPLLTGSAGAGYGPVLFLAHVPFQLLLDPQPVNAPTVQRSDLVQPDKGYLLPPPLATQLTTALFHILGVVSLILAARRLAGEQVGWALGALYCSSAYVLGVGGTDEMIGGMTFISHIAAPALALAAFALLEHPLVAGILLALSIGTVFYPVLFIPAWLGYYWRDRRSTLRFVAGMALVAVVIGGPVLAFSRKLPGYGPVGSVIEATVGHHQGEDAYGQSLFGFWGMRGGLRATLQDALIEGQLTTSPMFLLCGAFAVSTFFFARNASPGQLALLTGALALAAQIWKIHSTGVYVTWYYPMLLLGFLASNQPGPIRSPS